MGDVLAEVLVNQHQTPTYEPEFQPAREAKNALVCLTVA